MKWYEGGIAEAVAASKRKGAVFVVFIEGANDISKSLSDLLSNETISNKIENENFVAIKIEENSVPHQQFSHIYKEATKPSLYFIGKNGILLEVISNEISAIELTVKLDEITQRNAGPIPQSSSGATQSQNFIHSEQKSQNDRSNHEQEKEVRDQPKRRNNTSPRRSPQGADSLLHKQDKPEVSSSIETPDEQEAKLKKYQETIQMKKEEKELEEKQKEKEEELKRRKVGQDVQKLKRWQEEQDLKQLVEQREKQKREEQQARQRVLAQIAQDKAERAAKFASPGSSAQSPPTQPTAPITAPPKLSSNPNTARLQLRLPDGSSHTHEFASSATLQDVREFIAANLNMAFRTYTLSTMFPRREFSENDYSQTLADLQLVPNAVILILPINHTTVSNRNGGFFSVIWFFFTPFVTFFVWLKSRVMAFGGPNDGGTTGITPRTNLNMRQSTTDGQGPSVVNKHSSGAGKGSFVRREGNIHRLVDKKDKDDENNTWNGNSTQQM
ncbi:UBX domain-containing protein 4 [Agrilus planipennis]|uniref:UBX domain-containing protein 4 n=1 Tax=Agrilus planipennis TaxID=224129 RepID=A0A1W4X7J3_AGRPL|nr:UBX domain-containing protein 4 [Agrilus planipennis]